MHEQKTVRYFEFTLNNCGAIILDVGVIAIVGWITGFHLLTRISPKFIPMAPDTALAFVIFGILFLTYHHRSHRRLPQALTFGLPGIIGVYGLLKAIEYPLGTDLTFANALFPEKQFLGPYVVGRMSPVTGALFFLAGMAITLTLAKRHQHRMRLLAGWIGVAIASVGFLTTYAYVLGTPFFYKSTIIPLAAPTAFAFCFLGIGLIAAAGPEAVIKPFVGSNTKSRMLRLFVPLVVLTCFAQELLHHSLLTSDIHRVLVILIVPLAAALVAVAAGERLARHLSDRLQVAEKLLEESEEKYRGLFYNAQVGMFRSRIDGAEMLEVNEKILEILGWTREEMLAMPTTVHWADTREREEMTRRLKVNGSLSGFDFKLVTKHGDVRNCIGSARLYPEQGIMEGSVLDITERKRAEQLLAQENLKVRESERRLREAEQLAHLGNWELDLVSNSLYWSDEIYRIFDLAPQEFGATYRAFLDAIHPDDREYVNQSYLDSLARKTAYDIEHRLLMKNGRVKYVRECCQTYYDEDGKPFRSVGTVQDITERKYGEKVLRRQNAYLTALQETTLDLLAEHDVDRLLERILQRAGELVGTTTGWLDLLEPGANCLTTKIALGALATEARRFAVQKGEGLSGRVWESGQPITIEDYDAWSGRIQGHERGLIRSIVAVPLLAGSEVRGVLGLAYERGTTRIFDEVATNLLCQFAQMAALAIEDARLLSVANREITERKQVGEVLRESEERFRMLFDNLTIGVYRTTPDGKVLIANAALVRMFGCSSFDELAQLDLEEYGYAPSHPRSLFRMRLEQEGEIRGFESAWKRLDGSVVYLRENARAIRGDDGAILCYEGTAEDITEQKQSATTLEKLRRTHELTLKSAGEGILGLDANGCHTFVNPAAAHMLGYEPEELIGKPSHAIWHHTHRDGSPYPAEECHVYATINKCKVSSVSNEVFWRKDGSCFDVEYSTMPVIEDGVCTGAVVTFRDISERKQAEDSLRKSEKLLRDSQSIAHLGSYELDILAGVWTSSPALDDIFGIDEQFVHNVDGWLSLVHPEWRETMAQYLATEVLGKCRRFDKEYKIIRNNDGQECWVHGLGDLTFDEQGRPVKMIGTIQDISERKQADESLRRLRQAVETSGEIIFMTDINGTFTYINPAFTELYGYTPDDVIGKCTPRILKSGVIDANTYSQYWSTLLKGEIVRGELVNRTKDGKQLTVDVSVNPVVNEHRVIEGFLAVQRDISERKRAQEERQNLESQLRQAQKLETIGTLAGGIAHDFNNILTPIMAYTEMAAKRLGEGHPQRHDLEHVIAGANRAKDLVKQILSFSRQMEGEKIEIELSPIVKEALKLLQASLPSTIAIEANIQVGCGEVLADPSQIHQVLMNLCTNASHAMKNAEDGLLTVNLESVTLTDEAARAIPPLTAGKFVRLRVSDTGCGMDDKTMERIFEPFFTTKSVGEGTGLGLSVVHGIVKSHGGAITVQSKVGKGTVFEIYLPRLETTQKTLFVEAAAAVGGHEHILVVDDEPEVASVICDVLEEMFGYTVTVRTSSVEALELLRAQPKRFDLVITDLTMPHLAGDHLAREIQEFRKDLPVILMTGFSETINEDRCRQLGIAGFLLKPPLSADLARMVRSVLDNVPAA